MKEVLILQGRIAALEQYNQYLLERNEKLEDLVKKFIKLLEEIQNKLNESEKD